MGDVNSTPAHRPWILDAIGRLHTRRVLHQRDVTARPLLDMVRWISALLVLLGHAIGMVFARQGGFPSRMRPLDFISDLRGPAVVFFFVISGYLVGGSVLMRTGRFKVRDYAIARFARIYVVLVPAILLVCALDGTAHLIDPQSPVYVEVWRSGVLGREPINARYTLMNLISTITCLEPILGKPLGTGNALWSLGYEWIFYIAFPMLVVPLAHVRSLVVPLLPIGVLISALVLAGREFEAMYFAMWVAGAYARVMVDHAAVPRWFAWSGLIIALTALIVMQFAWVQPATLILALGFAMYLCRFEPGERGLWPAVDRPLANISYSLYVTHFPFIVFLSFLAVRAGALTVGGRTLDWIAVILLTIYVVGSAVLATVFSRLFEQRTDALRLWLHRMVR